jgi:hypothetical protein
MKKQKYIIIILTLIKTTKKYLCQVKSLTHAGARIDGLVMRITIIPF